MDVLTTQQQDRLNQAKARMRIENEEYLRQHPELQTFISMFMSKVLDEQPDDVLTFACEFFSNPENEAAVMEGVGTVGFTA
mmetsp:Transcript_26116/g.69516  ORF Transcript_26116/g.69516 Transcript_26116/m.69516 type:complete len:81 (-) Transcript_26116:370-612(-)